MRWRRIRQEITCSATRTSMTRSPPAYKMNLPPNRQKLTCRKKTFRQPAADAVYGLPSVHTRRVPGSPGTSNTVWLQYGGNCQRIPDKQRNNQQEIVQGERKAEA